MALNSQGWCRGFKGTTYPRLRRGLAIYICQPLLSRDQEHLSRDISSISRLSPLSFGTNWVTCQEVLPETRVSVIEEVWMPARVFMWRFLQYIYSDCNTSTYIRAWAYKCHPPLYRMLILLLFFTVSSTTRLIEHFLFHCWHFSINCWQSIVRSLSLSPTTSHLPWSDFFPFSWIWYDTKISHSIIHPTVDFSPISSLKSRERDTEDLRFSMGRQYGHLSCLYRRQNVVLTNPQMYLSFSLFLWILFTSYCVFFFFPAWKCIFAAGRALAACLSLNSLRALGLSQTPFFLFFPPACLSLH